ncbi:hypothetical protein D3C73_184850 [compost metagenome]
MNYYKIKPGTKYDSAVKKHFEQKPKWKEVMIKVGELLGENINAIALTSSNLYVDLKEIINEDNKKLFNKDGALKQNSKRGKQLLSDYRQIIKDAGLSEYSDLGIINFSYGVYRLHGETLRRFISEDYELYFETDIDLETRAKDSGDCYVVPITEVEYLEVQLKDAKNRKTA